MQNSKVYQFHPDSRGVEAEQIFNFQQLYRAYLSCRKNKRHTYHAAKFEINFESELLQLEQELQAKTYKPQRSICFVVTEPSIREIFAGSFRDRVVHHLLYNFLNPVFEPKFIHQSYACRTGKGTRLAVEDLKRYLRKLHASKNNETYFLHLDVKGFFMSIKKDILFSAISKHVKNPDILWLARVVIFNDPTERYVVKGDPKIFDLLPPHKSLFGVPKNQGLPIGNLTSQFFGNLYLNELDQFVKHNLKARFYLRYVDDFLFLSQDKEELKKWLREVSHFLKERLDLELNPKKQILQPVDKGIDWLGYIVRPDHILVRRKVVGRLKQKLYHFNKTLLRYPEVSFKQDQRMLPFKEYAPDLSEIQKMLSVINSYYGHFRKADSFRLRRHLYQNDFGFLVKYLEPKDDTFCVFQIRAEFLERAERARH